MSIEVSSITAHSTACLRGYSGKQHKKYHTPILNILCMRKPPVTGEFPSQEATNKESIFDMAWLYHEV